MRTRWNLSSGNTTMSSRSSIAKVSPPMAAALSPAVSSTTPTSSTAIRSVPQCQPESGYVEVRGFARVPHRSRSLRAALLSTGGVHHRSSTVLPPQVHIRTAVSVCSPAASTLSKGVYPSMTVATLWNDTGVVIQHGVTQRAAGDETSPYFKVGVSGHAHVRGQRDNTRSWIAFL